MSDIRTPPSLKWLLDKRARLLGEVQRFQKAGAQKRKLLVDKIVAAKIRLAELEERQAQRSPEEILAETYQRDLAVIDRTLQLHQIQIDVNLISLIRSQTGEKYLAHGELTRLIYQKLKSIYPSAATATETTLFILTTLGDEMDNARFDAFRLRVRHRMKNLAAQGKLIPIHDKNKRGGLHGRWRLDATLMYPPTTEALQVD